MVLSIKSGTSFYDAVTGYHLHPVAYLNDLWRAWTDKIYLGVDNGPSQLVLFPGAILYAALSLLGLGADASQKLVFFLLFFTSGLSVAWLTRVAATYLTAVRPVLAIAPLFYICNLYVIYTMVGNSPFLWAYAILPSLMALSCLAIRKRDPGRFGVLAALASVVMVGANPTLVIINLLALAAFLAFLVYIDADRRVALSIGTRYALVSLLGGLLCNSYWIVPFISYARTAWLPGVFSESIAWHSSLANVPDILRLLGGEGFYGRDPVYGWFYPYQQFYRDHGIVEIASRAVPLIAFATVLWRVARREPFLRFLIAAAILAVPMASGAHEGAWSTPIYLFLSEHVQVFQIFRETDKWNSIIALPIAILLAYQAGILRGVVCRQWPALSGVPTFAIAALGIVAIAPIIVMGPFRSQSMLRQIPLYWHDASTSLGLNGRERVALFPKQYLTHFFWGEVKPDFAGSALQQSTAYSIANDSGAPTAGSGFLLEAMYRGVASDEPWSESLLERMSISDVIEQRDAYYTTTQETSAPLSQMAELSSTQGLSFRATSGDLSDFHLRKTIPLLSVARPFVTPFNGPDLLDLFALLRSDEVTLAANGDEASMSSLPAISNAGNLGALAAELTPPLYSLGVSRGIVTFRIPLDENIRVFARTGAFVPWNSRARLLIDGKPGIANGIGDSWVQVAAFRATGGEHKILAQDPAIDVQVKILDANTYQNVYDRLAGSNQLGELFTINLNRQQFRVPVSERYRVRARVWPMAESSYEIPVSFNINGYLGVRNGESCVNLPVVPSDESINEENPPPRSWYYDSKLLPLTANGRVVSFWYPNSMPLAVFNPFDQAESVRISGTFAALGQERQLSLLGPDGIQIQGPVRLDVSKDDTLRNMSRELLLGGLDYDTLVGSTTDASYRVVLSKGWSSVGLGTSGYDALPNTREPLKGFIAFGSIGRINVVGCGHQAAAGNPAHAASMQAQRLTIHRAFGNARSAMASIEIPNISLNRIPSLRLSVDSSGTIALLGIVHYVTPQKVLGTYTISFSPSGSEQDMASLLPSDEKVALSSRIISVDIVATLLSARDAVVSHPRLALERTPVRRIGSVNRTGSLSDPKGIRLELRRVTEKQVARLVLDLYNADPSASDVSFEVPGGLYLGRSVELGQPIVERSGDSYAKLTFPLPADVPRNELAGWRRQVRVIAGNRELAPATSEFPLPYEFSLTSTTMTAVLPVGVAGRSQKWHMIYIPESWFTQSRYRSDTVELRIPLADGLTTVEGHRAEVGNEISLLPESRSQAAGRYRDSISLDAAFVEGIAQDDQPARATLDVDGRAVPLRATSYGWDEGVLALSAGVHEAYSTDRQNLKVLVLPDELAESASRSAHWQISQVDKVNWAANLVINDVRQPLLIVLREAFNPGWHAESGGRLLSHAIADGYANGYVVDRSVGAVRLDYWPRSILEVSRVISASALVLSLGVLIAWKVSRLLRGIRIE